MPHEFWVLAPDGELLPMEGAPLSLIIDATKKRVASVQLATKTSAAIVGEKAKLKDAIDKLTRSDRKAVRLVWDTVFWRRSLYFFTVGLTGVFAAYPWLDGIFTKTAHGLIRLIPIVGTRLDQRCNEWLSRLDDGSRGPITSLLDAVSGFIPSYAYAEPWTKVLEKHPVESTLIVAAIVASLRGSNIL